jgi:menaquinone-dependent protoporphyrinogen IX oxidase
LSTLVIYHSKYGSTKRYAKFIADALGADLKSIDEASGMDFAGFDTIVLGTYIMGFAACPPMKRFLRLNKKPLLRKKLAAFLVGGTPPNRIDKDEVIEKSFPEAIRRRIGAFAYYRGAMDYSRLSFRDKLVMRIAATVMPGKASIKKFNAVKKGNIKGFVAAVKKL